MADAVPALRCECGELLRLPEEYTATHFRCPACGRRIILRFEAPEKPSQNPSPATVSEPTATQTAEAEAADAGAGGEGESGQAEEEQPPEVTPASAFAKAERILLQEARFLRELGYVPSEGWTMTFQRPDLPPEQEPPTKPEELALCVGRQMQSDHFVPVILVVPVVESDPGSRHALRRALNWARGVQPLPVPLCLVSRGDRRRMFQTQGERPYDTMVKAEDAFGYLRGRSQRMAPQLRFADYPLLLREITAVLEERAPEADFERGTFAEELKERFGTDDPEQLTLAQAQEVTAELLERYGSRAPYQLLDIRFLTDQPAPEFEMLGDIVREKLTLEDYQEQRRSHTKRMFNIFALGCFVAIFLCVAEQKILAQGALVFALALVIAQERTRPIPPQISRYVPTRTLLWDRSVVERAALAALFFVVLVIMLLSY